MIMYTLLCLLVGLELASSLIIPVNVETIENTSFTILNNSVTNTLIENESRFLIDYPNKLNKFQSEVDVKIEQTSKYLGPLFFGRN